MDIKAFKCGLCRGNEYIGTRKGLRKHLREEHRIVNKIANYPSEKGPQNQNWWITETF